MINAYDSSLKAWAFVDTNEVMKRAKELDTVDWGQHKPEAILAGAPIGVKDIFNTVDHPNSMGSPTRQGYWPGNDARVVTAVKFVGAQIVGKTTTAEFAVHTAPETINPWGAKNIAGTSSTGSAVAVATGMVPAALATQSAGSIARPASYNGVVGFKPSFGMVPRTGVLKTCDTFDTIGWMTRNIEDALLLLDVARVRGRNYPFVEGGVSTYSEVYSHKTNYVLGKLKAPGFCSISDDSLGKWDQLALQLSNQAEIKVCDLDWQSLLSNAHEIHQIIYDKSLAYYFRQELSDVQFISPIFQEIVDRSREISPDMYFSALSEQENLTAKVSQAFGENDFLFLPTTAGEAPNLESVELTDSSLIWTLLGFPMVTVPLLKGRTGLPVGVTFVGRKYSDYELLKFVGQHVMTGDSEVIMPSNITA
ncbi:amidase [Owenweeksia hongkongensis]|uniref:amidase n=1 Tax=Owenweeksia hongkongensis TaxID=253245 RepID=UPI003A91DBAD